MNLSNIIIIALISDGWGCGVDGEGGEEGEKIIYNICKIKLYRI